MSFTLMAKVMGLKLGHSSKKIVLLKLADQANDDGFCWPSYQTIAEASELSRRTVIRHIQTLEKEGYLTISKAYDSANKRNFSNRYHLTLDRGASLTLVTNETLSGDTATPPSDTVTPKPINEPTIKPINKDIGAKKKKVVANKFVEPTVEQARDYFTERGHQDAVNESEKWIDHYISNGWKVGKNPMKDWKASIRNWMRDYKPQQTNYQGNNHANHQSANHSNQPKRSQADIYADKLNADLAQRFPDEFTAADSYYEARDCKPV